MEIQNNLTTSTQLSVNGKNESVGFGSVKPNLTQTTPGVIDTTLHNVPDNHTINDAVEISQEAMDLFKNEILKKDPGGAKAEIDSIDNAAQNAVDYLNGKKPANDAAQNAVDYLNGKKPANDAAQEEVNHSKGGSSIMDAIQNMMDKSENCNTGAIELEVPVGDMIEGGFNDEIKAIEPLEGIEDANDVGCSDEKQSTETERADLTDANKKSETEDYEMYKARYDELNAKMQAGETLTEEEKAEYQKLGEYLTRNESEKATEMLAGFDGLKSDTDSIELEVPVGDEQDEATAPVGGIYDNAESFEKKGPGFIQFGQGISNIPNLPHIGNQTGINFGNIKPIHSTNTTNLSNAKPIQTKTINNTINSLRGLKAYKTA